MITDIYLPKGTERTHNRYNFIKKKYLYRDIEFSLSKPEEKKQCINYISLDSFHENHIF